MSLDVPSVVISESRALFFIINPAASNGGALTAWEKVKIFLDSECIPYRFVVSESADHVAELAKEAALPGVVIAGVGGDGTISTIVGAISGTGALLGVIPGGTGNDLARTFAIPRDPVEACRVLLGGVFVPLDMGRLNGKCFVNVVGAGLDAEVVADANRIFKRYSGSLGYLLALLKQLVSFRPRTFKICVDDNVLETKAWLVAVANARYYGNGMKIAPGADPQDGLADVVIVRNMHRLNFLRLFPLVYRGSHVDHPAVTVLRGMKVSVECEQASSAHADGEMVGKTPLSIQMSRHAVSVLIPQSHKKASH